jgi:hypothetical protein
MPEGVAVGRFGDSGGQLGSADRLLDQGGIQVGSALPPRLDITPAVVLGERLLPGAILSSTAPPFFERRAVSGGPVSIAAGVDLPSADSTHPTQAEKHGQINSI